MALKKDYHKLWFESFRLDSTSGHRDEIQLHLEYGQDLPTNVLKICTERSIDPFSLLTECSKNLLYDYQVGTKFLLKSKLTDRENGGLFFYTHYKWEPFKILGPSKNT